MSHYRIACAIGGLVAIVIMPWSPAPAAQAAPRINLTLNQNTSLAQGMGAPIYGSSLLPPDAPVAIRKPVTRLPSQECADFVNMTKKSITHLRLVFTHVSPDYQNFGEEDLDVDSAVKPHERRRYNCRTFHTTIYHGAHSVMALYKGHPSTLLVRVVEVRFSNGTTWHPRKDHLLWNLPTTTSSNEVPILSDATIKHLIQQSLAEHAPEFWVEFSAVSFDRGDADLARAGILKMTKGWTSCYPGPTYDLTEKGRVEASRRGWRIGNSPLHGGQSDMSVPLGRLEYVPGSFAARVRNGDAIEVTFKYVYRGNPSAAYLLTLGPVKDWAIFGYVNPDLTLHDLGHVVTAKLQLTLADGKWTAREVPPNKPDVPIATC